MENRRVSHDTVGRVLRCEKMPTWDALDAVVEALRGDQDQFRRMWLACARQRPEPPRDRPRPDRIKPERLAPAGPVEAETAAIAVSKPPGSLEPSPDTGLTTSLGTPTIFISRDLEDLVSRSTRRRFAAGTVLFRQGSQTDHVHLLLEGAVAARAVAMTNRSGPAERLLQIHLAGELLGTEALFDGEAHQATLTAMVVCQSIVIRGAELQRQLVRRQSVARTLLSQMAERVRWNQQQRLQAALPLDERLVAFLLDLADRVGVMQPDGSLLIDIPLSQADLGAAVGASEVAVQRVLRTLRHDGLLATRYRKITLLDTDRARRYASAETNDRRDGAVGLSPR